MLTRPTPKKGYGTEKLFTEETHEDGSAYLAEVRLTPFTGAGSGEHALTL
jgi:hypothetical protein